MNIEERRAKQAANMRSWRAANPDKARAAQKRAYDRRQARDPGENARKCRARYHRLTPEQRRERARRNREVSREKVREAARRWLSKNLSKKNAETARRRAQKKLAMPAWADRAAIATIYRNCKAVSIASGVQHHVDHIVPLQSDVVCGLHVPWNLQILPAIENARKANRLVL